MEMKDCKMKDNGPGGIGMSTEDRKDRYPSISFGDTYEGLPLDMEDVEIGDKVVVRLIAKLVRKNESEDEKGEKCDGRLDIIEAGFKPYEESDMREKPISKIKSEIDDSLSEEED